MQGFLDKLKEYYRQKLIFQIQLTFQPQQISRTGKSAGIISRDSIVRFILTLVVAGLYFGITNILLKHLPDPLRLLLSAFVLFLVTETVDILWIKIVSTLDYSFDVVLPAIGLVLFVVIFGVIKYYPKSEYLQSLGGKFEQWKIEKNKSFVKPIPTVVETRGTNWAFLTEKSAYKPASFDQASAFCASQGAGWRIPQKEDFAKMIPLPTIPRIFYVWNSANTAFQLNLNVNTPPGVFSSAGPNDLKYVLCFKE